MTAVTSLLQITIELDNKKKGICPTENERERADGKDKSSKFKSRNYYRVTKIDQEAIKFLHLRWLRSEKHQFIFGT